MTEPWSDPPFSGAPVAGSIPPRPAQIAAALADGAPSPGAGA
jgi:hypothetical protein